jgi:hypothetical protein
MENINSLQSEPIGGGKSKICEISGSHCGDYKDDCLLRCCAVWYGKFTDVSEVLAASIINTIIEAASTSVKSVKLV